MAAEPDDLVEGPFLNQPVEDEREQRPAGQGDRLLAPKRPPSPNSPGLSRAHKKRRLARDKAAIERGQFPSARTTASYINPSIPLPTELVTEELPAAKGGYSALLGEAPGAKKAWLAMQLVEEEGFEYVTWDG